MSSFSWSPIQNSGGGVTTVNGLSGALTLAAGTGISITPSGNTLTFASTSAGDVTLTAVGSTPNANGASLSSQALTLQPANTSFPGVLLAADWNTFNSKQAAGNYITALTGDGTAAGPGSAALTLATVNASPGSFGSASMSLTATVNAKGLITALSSQSILLAESQVTNLVSDLAGKQATGNYITALTSDITASGPGSVAATLATVNSNVGSFGSTTSIPSFTVNGKGLITAASGNVVIAPAGTLSGATLKSTVVTSSLTSVGTLTSGTWNATTIALANGGTGQTTKAPAFDALQPMTTGGDIIYGGASGTGTRLANGSAGQFLKSNGTTLAPSWAAATVTYTAPTVQKFTSGSGTYTTPANVLYIKVTVAGGGGGGGSSGTASGLQGTAGTASTFGSSLLTANGGAGGNWGSTSNVPSAGGTATVSGPAIEVVAAQGGYGQGAQVAQVALVYYAGGQGGTNALGGAGASGFSTAGTNGSANTGGGGGGGGKASNASADYTGGGGGAGGYLQAIIGSPSATYAYAVGGGGSGVAAGTNGFASGNGGSGVVIIEEHYQ